MDPGDEWLRASGTQLRQLFETLPQIVWVTRPDGWHVHFNRQWFDFTGLTLEDSIGDGWNHAFHPDDRARAAARWAEATGSGEPYEIEYRLRRHDGAYHWMLGRAEPLRDADGTIVTWFGTCTDIEELKQAQERNDAQARLLDQVSDAIIAHDLGHRVLYWNRGAERIHGWTSEEAVGRHLCELVCPDSRQVDDALEHLLRDGEWSGELRYLHRSGSEVFVEGRWSLLRHPDGSPRAALSVNTDVTERRAIEDQYLASLEARATQDGLTGLPNRSVLFTQLELLLGQRQRTGIAVAFIDLDDFKPINDRLGHRAGDQVLVEVAERLRATIRQGDVAARIGGDEFVVVGEASDRAMALQLGQRLADAIAGEARIDAGRVELAASVGVAFAPSDDETTADDLVSRADAAMYEAKRRRSGTAGLETVRRASGG
ncbi:PAS domain S-box protein [Egicoccus sp. AB-alg6-2]|uniref:PAS domain S-box protein n=1 Tax=Egicoccus sp. AB-alg6-2 TaxID=3242692 RepID=UPI00359D7E95